MFVCLFVCVSAFGRTKTHPVGFEGKPKLAGCQVGNEGMNRFGTPIKETTSWMVFLGVIPTRSLPIAPATWPWVKIQIVPPVNTPIPTKIGSKMGSEFTENPKWDDKTVLTHGPSSFFGGGSTAAQA